MRVPRLTGMAAHGGAGRLPAPLALGPSHVQGRPGRKPTYSDCAAPARIRGDWAHGGHCGSTASVLLAVGLADHRVRWLPSR